MCGPLHTFLTLIKGILIAQYMRVGELSAKYGMLIDTTHRPISLYEIHYFSCVQ